MTDLINPLYTASGFAVGFLVGMTGVGGGSLMTPLLVVLFGIHPVTAVGTDLLYAAITKSGGTLVHGFNRNIDWRITARLALGSVPATAASLFFLHHMGLENPTLSHLLSLVLGGAVLLAALLLILRPWLLALATRRFGEPSQETSIRLTVLTGAFLGVLVTLSSIGAGALGTMVLLVLYPRLPTTRIVGSDIAHAVPLTLLAGLGHWMLGSVDWDLLLSLITGSLPGIFLGSLLSARIPDGLLRGLLAAVLALVGAKLLF